MSNDESDPGVPAAEVYRRVAALQAALIEQRVDGAVLVQSTDLYYYTGTSQDAHLVVPAAGEPLLLVRRSVSRARSESPLARIEPLQSLRDLPRALHDAGIAGRRLGFELDVLPASRYLTYARLLPEAELLDCSSSVRALRAVKSGWELERIERAAEQLAVAMETVAGALRVGVTELELLAEVERALRRAGHQGTIRTRGSGMHVHYGSILAGPSAAVPGGWDAALVGPGPNRAVGAGSSARPISESEPVVVDLFGAFDGYLADATRTFVVGKLPDALVRAYENARAILHQVALAAKPGVTGAALYELATDLTGDATGFMGVPGESIVSFVGHGVGLESDEPPFLARGWDLPLEEGMVFALEPKFVDVTLGAVGIENTYVVEPDGSRALTLFSEDVTAV